MAKTTTRLSGTKKTTPKKKTTAKKATPKKSTTKKTTTKSPKTSAPKTDTTAIAVFKVIGSKYRGNKRDANLIFGDVKAMKGYGNVTLTQVQKALASLVKEGKVIQEANLFIVR